MAWRRACVTALSVTRHARAATARRAEATSTLLGARCGISN
eukprot:CAMPEP_0173414626 /NCGR_PEP_ID=MMETSP1356-20130122/84430_1 /TAXON_ID=77927 ORGANISM="Hemiselmis virescens, Strain PCC157" /NCGR_SAMPLE_ID=MMETSP1356 /ASSEMBLY_ACC=CAM_ASM_000847 /LENGTH=40 /DNA_ID= /DNA_START= /DNA_END= /DNA_ORIENTATION=